MAKKSKWIENSRYQWMRKHKIVSGNVKYLKDNENGGIFACFFSSYSDGNAK